KHCEMKFAQLITRPPAPRPKIRLPRRSVRHHDRQFADWGVAQPKSPGSQGRGLHFMSRPPSGKKAFSAPLSAGKAWRRSGVIAELAGGIRLAHQRLARRHVENLPEVLRVLHLLRRLAAHDDD